MNKEGTFLPEGIYMTPAEYAAMVGVTRIAIHQRVKKNKLVSFRIGRQILIKLNK